MNYCLLFYLIKGFCEFKISKLVILFFLKYFWLNWDDVDGLVVDYGLLFELFI